MGLLQVQLTVVMGWSCCQSVVMGGKGEFELDGRELAEAALPATPVVGVFDPGDDRESQLVAGTPALLVEDVLLQQRVERLHRSVVPS